MSAPIREGEILAGKYRVERVLAQGGMGIVVAAIHQQLDQRVALKFMLPSDAPREADYGRFMREAKAAVRLRSEHVAKVLDVGTAETGSPYIVMEYLDGRDLDVVLQENGPLSPELAVSYVLQACEAVAEAHALGIVHRDLKPANLFLTTRADGTACVKVLDFGISKLLDREDPIGSLTKTSAMMGTPIYMAPEQIRSSKQVDRRSDIWALGMILYELLTGRTAFVRDTLLELCSSILTDMPAPPTEVRADIPDGLSTAILRALEKEPAARFSDLAAFVDALAPFCTIGPESSARVHRILGGSSQPSVGAPISGVLPTAAAVARASSTPRTPPRAERPLGPGHLEPLPSSVTVEGAQASLELPPSLPVESDDASVHVQSARTSRLAPAAILGGAVLVGLVLFFLISRPREAARVAEPVKETATAASQIGAVATPASVPLPEVVVEPPSSARPVVPPVVVTASPVVPSTPKKPIVVAPRPSVATPKPVDTLAPFGPRT
jgi:serine/threonine-protein kinase